LNALLVLFLHFFQLFREGGLELGIDLSESEINNHASFGFWVVEEVSGFDVTMINAELFEVPESN
jgi:hypothetical protein